MTAEKIIASVLIATLLLFSSGCIETGKGVSQDTLYGLEYNGIVWKTWSVWLTNDHPYEGHSAIYSISKGDTETLNKINDSINSKQKVNVFYRNYLIWWPWDYSSGTVIYDVKK